MVNDAAGCSDDNVATLFERHEVRFHAAAADEALCGEAVKRPR
jgi:hypothetical protein